MSTKLSNVFWGLEDVLQVILNHVRAFLQSYAEVGNHRLENFRFNGHSFLILFLRSARCLGLSW